MDMDAYELLIGPLSSDRFETEWKTVKAYEGDESYEIRAPAVSTYALERQMLPTLRTSLHSDLEIQLARQLGRELRRQQQFPGEPQRFAVWPLWGGFRHMGWLAVMTKDAMRALLAEAMEHASEYGEYCSYAASGSTQKLVEAVDLLDYERRHAFAIRVM
jgi:hypothetical protein